MILRIRRSLPAFILGIALVGACTKDAARQPEVRADTTHVASPPPPPRDSVFAATFLEFLGADLDSSAMHGGFDVSKGGHWNVDSTLAFLSDSGVTFYDGNKKTKTWHTSIKALRAEVTARSGKSYETLVHVGYIAAIPYPQYSSLGFKQSGDSTFVTMGGDWYKLVLVREGTSVRVVRIEYLQIQDL